MSKSVESESDDDDCEYFLQPTSNQYNITDKIKEANQQLYKSETNERQSQPKVRFKESVDFEPDDDIDEVMENRSVTSSVVKSGDESSDDGYIDDDNSETAATIEEVVEAEEIEEVDYEKNDFHAEEGGEETTIAENAEAENSSIIEQPSKKKQTFRPKSSRVSPVEETNEKINKDDKKRSKYCCQFKNEYNMKLPKYSGFNSNYGLSKDEIAKREYVKHKSEQHKQLRNAQQLEEKKFLASQNEEAFAKWLSKKMCNTVNKSNPINMFDVQGPSKNFRRIPKQL